MQCNIPIDLAPEFFNIWIALSISSRLEAPVDISTGFDLEPIFLKKGRLLISADATLKNFSSEIRLTLDYKEDYLLLEKLFNFDEDITSEKAIEYMNNNPELIEINRNCFQNKVRLWKLNI